MWFLLNVLLNLSERCLLPKDADSFRVIPSWGFTLFLQRVLFLTVLSSLIENEASSCVFRTRLKLRHCQPRKEEHFLGLGWLCQNGAPTWDLSRPCQATKFNLVCGPPPHRQKVLLGNFLTADGKQKESVFSNNTFQSSREKMGPEKTFYFYLFAHCFWTKTTTTVFQDSTIIIVMF